MRAHSERQSADWDSVRLREALEDSQAQTHKLRREEDEELECDLTYGEVQQRLDHLQDHLNRFRPITHRHNIRIIFMLLSLLLLLKLYLLISY